MAQDARHYLGNWHARNRTKLSSEDFKGETTPPLLDKDQLNIVKSSLKKYLQYCFSTWCI